MLRPDPMVHVEILVPESDLLPVVEYIGRLGALHLTRPSRRTDTLQGPSSCDATALASWRDLTERLTKLMAFVGVAIPATRSRDRRPSHVTRETASLNEEVVRLEREAEDVEAAQAFLSEENERLETLRHQLEPLAHVDVDITTFAEFRHVSTRLGTVPNESLPRLRKSLAGYGTVILTLHRSMATTVILAFAPSMHDVVLGYALGASFFDPIIIPDHLRGTPAHILETIDDLVNENQSGLSSLEEERIRLGSKHERQMVELWYQTDDNRRTFEMVDMFLKAGESYVVTGWLPARMAPTLETTISEMTDQRTIVSISPPTEGDEDIPTNLQNPFPIRSFEALTTAYGVPAYDEIDPTPIVALSSLLMFGIMFGDVGHGLSLVLLGYLTHVTLSRRVPWIKVFTPLVMAGGIASTLFGFLFGSIFGHEELFTPLWLSPYDRITELFFVACAFGSFVMLIGLAFNISILLRRRSWGEALLDKYGCAGTVFYLAFLWTGISYLTGGGEALGNIHAAAMIIPLVIIACRTPIASLAGIPIGHTDGDNPLTMVVEAGIHVFETLITFFSNTLSFVRLAAFAVCHAALSHSVIALASEVAGGGVIGWVVIILGNGIIIIFEGLIVAIQTMRLEYYEFFSKFFRCGGIPYRPFAVAQR